MKSILITGGSGYIGSALRLYFQKYHLNDFRVTNVDIMQISNPMDYRDLNAGVIRGFDVIIHLAGHSSVQSCDTDPLKSLKNNCIDFFHFANKVSPYQKLIYASSASVYGKSGLSKETDILPIPVKEYDRQKQMIDYFMEDSGLRYYGLRFGTVCGGSPNPRHELLLNSMVKSAIKTGYVNVQNGGDSRAVLGLQDLCRAITAIIEKSITPGIYNLASFNDNIFSFGVSVSNRLSSSLSGDLGKGGNYSFELDTSKFSREAEFKFTETVDNVIDSILERNNLDIDRLWN